MKNMTVFESPEFGSIRTVELDGEPWLVGKDVAQALGYQNPHKAISCLVDDKDKTVAKVSTSDGDHAPRCYCNQRNWGLQPRSQFAFEQRERRDRKAGFLF